MAAFAYRAADRRGHTVAGVMEAADLRTVVERLHQDAYYPIEVTERQGRRSFSGRIRGRDLVAFTQQLATLLEAGLPLDRALTIQAELTTGTRLRAVTRALLESVRGGSSLGDALARHHPRPFSRLYVNMVRAGERSGALEATLRRLAALLEATQALRDALASALIYPALLTGVGAAAVIFLLTFVIPRFAEIFRELGGAIPAPTVVLLTVSDVLRRFWWLLGLGTLAVAVGTRAMLATPRGRLGIDRLALRLPVFRDVVRGSETARFTRVLGTLLGSGVPLVLALAVVKDVLTNQVLARAVAGLGDAVKRGTGLHKPMAAAGVFPPLAVHMVRVGEETGRLEDMLLTVGATFEEDTRRRLQRLVALAEPGIILVMGLVVGSIVVAMLLAIFSISEIPL